MAYEAMTVEKMVAKIKAGGYDSATAVRRGIGKLKDVNNAGKEKIQAAVEAYFGADAAPKSAKAGKAPKAPKAPKAVKQTSAKQVAKKAGRKAAAHAVEPASSAGSFDATPDMLAKIHLAGERVGTIAQAIAAMKAAKDINSNIELGDGPQIAAEAINSILSDIQTTVTTALGNAVPEEDHAPEAPVVEPEQVALNN
jgi:hypothetical protein